MAKRRRTDNTMAKRRRTDNTMAKRKQTKTQTMVDIILLRKFKIEHKPGEIRCFRRVGSSCPTSGTCYVTLVKLW
jgi:hypothetical protein